MFELITTSARSGASPPTWRERHDDAAVVRRAAHAHQLLASLPIKMAAVSSPARLVAQAQLLLQLVGAGPDDDEVVDLAVVVVVVLREVVSLGVVVVERLRDERLTRGVAEAAQAGARVGRRPAEHVAAEVELAVRGAHVVVVQALVGEIGGVRPAAEQLGIDGRRFVVVRVVGEIDEKRQDLDAAFGRHAGPASRRGQDRWEPEFGALRLAHGVLQERRIEPVVAERLGVRERLVELALLLESCQFPGPRPLERQSGRHHQQQEHPESARNATDLDRNLPLHPDP